MARFNTALTSSVISGTATIGTPYSGAFTEFTGTAPYTVTLPSPTLFPGVNQTFYNATSGQVTLSVSGATFNGTGGTGSATFVLNAGNVVSIFSDGTNYIVISEDGSPLTATTGSFSGNVTINGGSATLSVTAQTVTLNPTGTSTIDNINIGSNTRGSGAFNTLTANQAVTFTAGTASTTSGTGTLVVTGGLGVSGNINSGATVTGTNLAGTITTASQSNITSLGTLTSLTTSGLIKQTVNTLTGTETTAYQLWDGSANNLGSIRSYNVNGYNQNIRIYAASGSGSSTEAHALTIRYDGYVGIGTTNPLAKLQVFGGQVNQQVWINYDANKAGYLGVKSSGDLQIYAYDSVSPGYKNILLAVDGATTAAGTVGVGTINPGALLSVAGTLGVSEAGNTGNRLQITSTAAGAVIFQNDNSPIIFKTSTATQEKMRITDSGLVGIGIATPAYKLHVAGTAGIDDARLTAVSASIASTATSVFVYDTRKDSDGGAWRKRTQNTSWYNETLNTATRGSRREFPAVAVIVAGGGATITIYDGDDPLMPMWIKYTYLSWDGPIRGISAVNGIIAGAIGTSINYSGNGLVLLDFIKDRQSRNYISGYSNLKNGFVYELLSTTRLDTTYLTIGTDTREYTLGNYNATDVAMTVLPNAPIDSATGLPIPTIAVTTFSGIYVIHNNGIVNSINATDSVDYNYWRSVEFTKDYKLIINGTYAGVANNIVHVCDIPYTNFSGNLVNTRITALNSRYYHSDSSIPNLKPMELARTASMDINTFAIGGASNTGFNIIAEAPDTASGINSSAMIVYVAPTYNTGWMVGNIKATWLADSTVETLTTTNLITNPTFTGATGSTGPTSWDRSALTGSPTFSVASNILTVNNTSGTGYWLGQVISGLVVGKTYSYSCTVTGSGAFFRLSKGGIGGNANNTDCFVATAGAGTYTGTFLAESGTTVAVSLSTTPGTTGTFTAVSVWSGDTNRSIGGNQVLTTGYNGLQTFGSITKSLIDTGNDLVAYSGWSNSNYFEQPYTSLLDYGTGDFYYTFWIKTDASAAYSSNTYVFERSSVSDVSGRRVEVRASSPSNLQAYAANTTVNATVPITAGEWSKFDWVRRSGTMFIYVNGLFISSITLASTVSDTSASLVIGNRAYFSPRNSGLGTTTKLALFKTSATAPSDVQILRMYNDERELFLPGSKACLYGSSGVITAVAFDNATNLLHVGTSAGRSVFQGLRRVDNTSTAVATSISASNGLVAEQ